MSKYSFSSAERFAVFTVHGGKCYMCRMPLDYTSMEVDHIVPEQLLDDPAKLAEVLVALGRPIDFDINSFENWLPSCRSCNAKKSAMLFDPAPIVLINIQIAQKKANEARRLATRTISDRQIGNAIAQVEVAVASKDIEFEKIRPLVELFLSEHHDVIKMMISERSTKRSSIGIGFMVQEGPLLELRLTPFAKVVYRSDQYELVQTPYGTGYRPTTDSPDGSFYCGHCGSLGPWSGARCLSCGFLSDND